jgi:Rha family phage regulatory protein
MSSLIPSPSVSLVNGRPSVTSMQIAEHFGKRHDHVVRDIRRIISETPEEFRIPNFGETFRTVAGPNNSARQEVYFIVFFDGFMLLVMGYTGKQALQIKLVYIAAFNSMREQLAERYQSSPLEKYPFHIPNLRQNYVDLQ